MLDDGLIYEAVREGMRVLLLLGFPLLVAVLAASIVGGVLQSALAVKDHAISYVLRLAAFILVLYLLAGEIQRSLTDLAVLALG